MSKTPINTNAAELESLLALMADDRLSPTEAARLEGAISTNDDARRQYIEMASLCADIEWTCGMNTLAPTTLNTQLNTQFEEEQAIHGNAGVGTNSVWRLSAAFTIGAMAASLLLLAFGTLQLPGNTRLSVSEKSVAKANPAIVNSIDENLAKVLPISATLTGLVDCQWAPELAAPTYGEQLLHGRSLKLESGLAQLTFESGAKLILQGPAEFVTRSDMLGMLNVGKLTAVVPEQAHGFTVTTPSAEVIDLGTEFGIEVDNEGRTEVHVFEGEVLSWKVGEKGEVKGEAMSLFKDMGAAYTLSDPTPKSVSAVPSQFVREVTIRLAKDQLPQLPVLRDLAFWVAADVFVKKDKENRVIAWRDILIGDNQMDEDVWQHDQQHRPIWVGDAIGSKPALRFDGQSSYMVTTPLPTTKDQTLFFVFQHRSDPIDIEQKGQLINYNGPPFNLPDPSSTFRILQIGDMETPQVYRGIVYAGYSNSRRVHFGEVCMNEPAASGEPFILSYTFNTLSNQAELIINGVSQGTTTAPSGMDVVSRKIIGKHPKYEKFFQGDMAEVLIYNAGLPTKQVALVTRYLSEKYSIPIHARD